MFLTCRQTSWTVYRQVDTARYLFLLLAFVPGKQVTGFFLLHTITLYPLFRMLRPVKNKYLFLASLAGMMLLPVLLLLALQTTQVLLKASAAERHEGAATVSLVLDAQQVQWEKQGQELQIGGCYFDVTRVEQKAGKLLVTGHFDDAETAVWQMFAGTLAHTAEGSLFNRLLLMLQCFVAVFFLHQLLVRTGTAVYRSPSKTHFYSGPLILVVAPPPQQSQADV